MKKLLCVLIVAVMIAGIVFGSTLVASSASDSSNPSPNAVVANPVVKWDKKAEIQILGSAFTPKQQIYLLITDSNDIRSDFTAFDCAPEPVPNEQGAFATEWSGLGRMISKGLLEPGAYAIEVTDENYKTLATAPLWILEEEE